MMSLPLLGCSPPDAESPLATNTETSNVSSEPQVNREAFLPSFAAIVAQAKPAVVNIATTQTLKTPERQPFFGPSPFGENNPFEDFFRHFFPDTPKTFKRQSLGSGFVIDPQGIIVTNHHVIGQADEIVVRLEKEEFKAQVLGSDPATDLALLKIKPDKKLTTLSFADSSQLQVGDWVIAIGNPFGLSQTVTAGIVSATGRVIGQGPYDDFIQTDASINPGNSGGPLLNLQGEVIGINTAIFSQTGGNIGIGFATPSNLAHSITEELRANGKIVRGWLGVAIQDLNEELAKAFGLSEMQGALVADLQEGAPADKAGFKRGDVIVSFRGKSVKSAHDLSREVAATHPGVEAEVEIIRKGKKHTLTVEIGEQPSKFDAQ
jgi:serine protease Do